ncbi:beta-ketoacyl synthase N-terminal-like domain-containing protein [Streptomyces mutabilis]|uniref:Polyketide synthase n=1 Tax=Streptomyces mutabilis TaxID=67332 RepID=A0A086MU64_9ACTN|nr:beta-ketoacyl synthase N-terminal-like domain-containing protein [Streptomyces mutabilis]KFG72432.1 hypothetical protein FM21_30285 [Streptomyces mutabilis]
MSITFEQVEELAQSSATFYEFCERYPRTRPLRIYQERDECTELNIDDLERRVRTLGTRLQRRCAPQQRVMLLLPRIEDYVVGLLACFHANVVAVPTVVDASARSDAKAEMIAAVLADSGASCALADEETRRWLEPREDMASAVFLGVPAADDDEPETRPARGAARDDLAMMMYTSGSTSQPKGVMFNHRSLVFQAALAALLWEIDSDSTVVSWLPLTHNFGLPLGLLTPLIAGASTVLLAPELFIQYPEHWFELIDRHAGTHAGATNSALEFCVDALRALEPGSVSLSSVLSVFCAGEPIRAQSVAAFAEAFGPLGLRPDAVRPHYGLTEVGCLATESSDATPTVLEADLESLGQGRAERAEPGRTSRALVRNGRIRGPVQVEIVDPESHELRPPGRIGEIWFKSTATCQGYYNKPEENARTFGATIATTGESGFFRTGDLGFVRDEHLYLVGRAKELLIVNGMKFYPPDLETTLRKRIPELRLNTAVFPLDTVNGERIVLVQELAEPLDEDGYQRLVQRIRSVVSDYYGISLYDIVFAEPDAIPRSGIGKVKRNGCRDRYTAGELPVRFRLRRPDVPDGPGRIGSAEAEVPAAEVREVVHRLAHEVVAPVLVVAPEQVLAVGSIGELGCTSVQYIQLAKRIEEVFGLRFAPARLFKYGRVAELGGHIARELAEAASATGPSAAPGTRTAAGPVAESAVRRDAGSAVDDGAVAVIGISCRFPGGANDPDAFWRNLDAGRDAVTRIRDSRPQIVADQLRDRGDLADFPEFAGFTDGVDEFDAAFFGIAPLEAQAMDPQQRRLMELTWHLLEDSGYQPSRLRGRRVGVYVGAHTFDYAELLFNRPELVDTYGAYMDSGTHPAFLANRISRWYDFHGPSRVFNTACSSSLVALDAAVADLRAGTCSEAVVGGVNTLLSARSFACNFKAGMQAADGRCKTFDERADGYVRAEGYGAVLLKPLAAAERDGDRVHGVIRGTAVNHDGQADSLRAPNPAAQAALIEAAFADAGIAPATVGYVEAHGTGTALGDPIEVQALVDAFHTLDPDLPPASCGLGSVKTAIGHLESAAGVAGLIKVLLSMRHRRLPGLLHFSKLNPFIELEKSPFRVVDRAEAWERRRDASGAELPLRAGLSSFGFGGANAHAIVEEYRQPVPAAPHTDHGSWPILLSARDSDRLTAQARRLLDHLQSRPADPAALARTLRTGREPLPERLAFTAGSLDEIRDGLRRFLQGERGGTLFTGNAKQSREFSALFGEDEELVGLLARRLASGDHTKALELWVKGVAVDWSPLDRPGEGTRPLAPLPGYPFAPDRHWFTDTFDGAAPVTAPAPRGLHPLVAENVSDLSEQRFRTRWTGQEFFLRDHVVHGRPTLPSAAWLEAVRAAVALAHSAGVDRAGIRLTELAWHAPYIHGPASGPVDISLMVAADGGVDFDCYRPAAEADPEGPVEVFFQGRARLGTGTAAEASSGVDPRLLTEGTRPAWSAPDVEGFLATAGVHHGPAYQALTDVHRGPGRWVAELSLPAALRPAAGDFLAHPVLLTAALQVAALWPGRPEGTVSVLAGIDEALFLARCDGDALAVVTEQAAPGPHGIPLLDLGLYDPAGRPLLRLSGIRFADRTPSVHAAHAHSEGSS